MKKLLENKILVLNVVFSFLFLILIIFSQKFTFVMGHGYFYPWVSSLETARFPSVCYEYLLNNFFPNILNINSNDFRSGVGFACIFMSLIYFAICLVFTNGFFLNTEEKKSIYDRKEFIFVFFLSFILLSLPLGYLDGDYANYFRIEDLGCYAEYFLNYLPLFMYFFFFFYCVKNKENIKFKKIHLFILIIFSFMTGAYNEITNLTAFFSSVIMLFLLFFYDKERLFNKNILYPLIPFCLGMVHYYFICDSFNNVSLGQHNINLYDSFLNSLTCFDSFFSKFYLVMIKSKIIYFILIGVLSYFVLRKRNKILNISVLFVFSLFLGYLIVNILTLFVGKVSGYNSFLFERYLQDSMYVNVLEYSILVLFGTIYASTEKKNVIRIILIISILILGLILGVSYNKVNQEKNVQKQFFYNFDKRNIVYSILGEVAIYPKSYFEFSDFRHGSLIQLSKIDSTKIQTYSRTDADRYFGKSYFNYGNYLLGVYKQDFKGAIFVDDEVAEKELDKRLELLDETKEDMNVPRGKYISFNNLYKKYKGKKFTSDELLKIEERKSKSPILTKAIAYAYYQEKEYDKSIELYKEYLKEEPNDFDANLNIADMYIKEKEYEKALEYLYKLNSIDEKILNVMFKLLNIYVYEKKDKERAIEVCDKMISINNKMHSLYLNKAIVYFHFEDKESAEKVLIESKKVDEENANMWLKMIKSHRFSEQKLVEPPLHDFFQ